MKIRLISENSTQFLFLKKSGNPARHQCQTSSKFNVLLHKTYSKVLLVQRYHGLIGLFSIISLSKRAYWMWTYWIGKGLRTLCQLCCLELVAIFKMNFWWHLLTLDIEKHAIIVWMTSLLLYNLWKILADSRFVAKCQYYINFFHVAESWLLKALNLDLSLSQVKFYIFNLKLLW